LKDFKAAIKSSLEIEVLLLLGTDATFVIGLTGVSGFNMMVDGLLFDAIQNAGK